MKLTHFKKDRNKLLALRAETSRLRWEIEKAVNISKHSGALHDHDYVDTWDIIHPKSGEPFKAKRHWFDSFGTEEQKEMIKKRRDEIEQSICAAERRRREKIFKKIEEIYEKYRYLWEGLESYPHEGRACDGESDLADLLWVAQKVVEMCEST